MTRTTRIVLAALLVAPTSSATAQAKPKPKTPAAAPANPVVKQPTQREELERIIQRKLLANGLEVIVIENHGVPLATVELVVKNGAFTQTPEYAGLAHMYEHMFFKSNDDYPQPDQFVARGERTRRHLQRAARAKRS